MFSTRMFCLRMFAARYYPKIGSSVGVRAFGVISFALADDAALSIANVTDTTIEVS